MSGDALLTFWVRAEWTTTQLLGKLPGSCMCVGPCCLVSWQLQWKVTLLDAEASHLCPTVLHNRQGHVLLLTALLQEH